MQETVFFLPVKESHPLSSSSAILYRTRDGNTMAWIGGDISSNTLRAWDFNEAIWQVQNDGVVPLRLDLLERGGGRWTLDENASRVDLLRSGIFSGKNQRRAKDENWRVDFAGVRLEEAFAVASSCQIQYFGICKTKQNNYSMWMCFMQVLRNYFFFRLAKTL